MQLAVEGLTQIGIEARLSTPEEGPWDNMLKSGDFDVGINSIRGGVTPHFMFDLALYSALLLAGFAITKVPVEKLLAKQV